MAQVIHYYVKYGQAVVLPFTAQAPLTSGARQTLITGATGPVTADLTISKDSAALGAPTGIITQVGTKLYTYNASAADMTAQRILAIVSDAAGAAFDDVTIIIETILELGQLNANASNMAAGNSGIVGTGVGTGHGIQGVPGASGKICNFFDTIFGAEPASAWNSLTSTVADALQHLAARFYHSVVTSGTQQTVYKRGGVTALDTMTITPTGSTVQKGEAS